MSDEVALGPDRCGRMASLHYGPTMRFELDPDTTKRIMEEIGGHATRGGWVTLTDLHAKEWTILVTPGIPIWIEPDPT
jgi:hypothetical protein